jgi:hypothetical protein
LKATLCFSIDVGHIVLGSVRGYGSNGEAADKHFHFPLDIELQVAVINGEFQAWELHHGFGPYQEGGPSASILAL